MKRAGDAQVYQKMAGLKGEWLKIKKAPSRNSGTLYFYLAQEGSR
jgi:hypothetical protein